MKTKHFRLTLDLEVSLNNTDRETIICNIHDVIEHAGSNGLFTGSSDAVLEKAIINVCELETPAQINLDTFHIGQTVNAYPKDEDFDYFSIGQTVNAHPKDGDFEHSFTGTVISKEKGFIQVRDQDDDVFDCDPDQLTVNTDDIMHD